MNKDEYLKKAQKIWKDEVKKMAEKGEVHDFLKGFKLTLICPVGIMGHFKRKSYALVIHTNYRDIDGDDSFEYVWNYKIGIEDEYWKPVSTMKAEHENYEKVNQFFQVLKKIEKLMYQMGFEAD